MNRITSNKSKSARMTPLITINELTTIFRNGSLIKVSVYFDKDEFKIVDQSTKEVIGLVKLHNINGGRVELVNNYISVIVEKSSTFTFFTAKLDDGNIKEQSMDSHTFPFDTFNFQNIVCMRDFAVAFWRGKFYFTARSANIWERLDGEFSASYLRIVDFNNNTFTFTDQTDDKYLAFVKDNGCMQVQKIIDPVEVADYPTNLD